MMAVALCRIVEFVLLRLGHLLSFGVVHSLWARVSNTVVSGVVAFVKLAFAVVNIDVFVHVVVMDVR